MKNKDVLVVSDESKAKVSALLGPHAVVEFADRAPSSPRNPPKQRPEVARRRKKNKQAAKSRKRNRKG